MVAASRKPATDLSALFDVFVLSQSVHELLSSALAGAPLTPQEYAIYSALLAHPGSTPSDLAKVLAAPPTTVSDWVRTMTRRGHVQREVDPADRRSYRITLTDSGYRAQRTTLRLFERANSAFLARLSSTEENLRALLAETSQAARRAKEDLEAPAVVGPAR